MNADKLSKCGIDELQELLHDISNVGIISMKITDINGVCEELKRSYHTNTKMVNECDKKISNIVKKCDEIEEIINNRFNSYGIDEDNISNMEERIERLLKKKLCNSVKYQMKDNIEVYQNTTDYIDQYFQVYDISKKTNNLVDHIVEWIYFIQNYNEQKQ